MSGRVPAPSPVYVGPPFRHSGNGNKPIRRVVIHSAVCPCEPGWARRIGAYFRSSGAGGSAHYVVDPDEVVQSAWDSVVCWHAPPNGGSLGVEMCDNPGRRPETKDRTRLRRLRASWRWARPAQRRMLDRTAELTAQLCLAYGLPLRWLTPRDLAAGRKGITSHDNVSRTWRQSSHWDPGWWPRRRFMRRVRHHARQLREQHR